MSVKSVLKFISPKDNLVKSLIEAMQTDNKIKDVREVLQGIMGIGRYVSLYPEENPVHRPRSPLRKGIYEYVFIKTIHTQEFVAVRFNLHTGKQTEWLLFKGNRSTFNNWIRKQLTK